MPLTVTNIHAAANFTAAYSDIEGTALVTITDRGGTLEAIGFRDGDLIVGIDGNEFESSMQMQIILMQSIAKAKVTFTLERGSQRVELEVNPKDLMNPQKQGGRIEPTSR